MQRFSTFQRTKEWANKVNLSSFEFENFFKFRACVISARKAKHLDATTMFTYSHANTPLGQSERAYYLSYFINNSSRVKNIPITELPYIWNGFFFFWSFAMCKKLKDFMITPTCYSSRFCARYTYSFSRDDSPANVFEDNRMIWLALRFLKSKKISPFLFFLAWGGWNSYHENVQPQNWFTDFASFSMFFFRPSCKKGNPRQKMFEFIK